MVLLKTTKWIENEIIPSVVQTICSLKEFTIERYSVVEWEGMKDNFASIIFEIKVCVQYIDSQEILTFLLKIMPEDEISRSQGECEKQFFNEIHFYSLILPQIMYVLKQGKRSELQALLPKFYYHVLKNNKIPVSLSDAVLAMENLKERGFRLGNRVSLDFKHCSLALRCLGSFHAISYFLKKNDLNTFKALIEPIQNIVYADVFNKGVTVSQERLLRSLLKELPHDNPSVMRLKNIACRKASDVLRELTTAKEPLSVLCHGDFLRNNIMFRYEGHEPVEMKLIDFQKIVYASPAIDVSLLLCMSTSHEVRNSHFTELLHIYYNSLTQALTQMHHDNETELDYLHSYDAFVDEMRTHTLYAFVLAINFIPVMMASDASLAEMVNMWKEEPGSPNQLAKLEDLGGPEATMAITTLAKDLIQYGFL